MYAIRKKDYFYFELSDVVKDKKGNEYSLNDIVLVPTEASQVIYKQTAEQLAEARYRYAGMAMQSLLSLHGGTEGIDLEKLSKKSVKIADALVKELLKDGIL